MLTYQSRDPALINAIIGFSRIGMKNRQEYAETNSELSEDRFKV